MVRRVRSLALLQGTSGITLAAALVAVVGFLAGPAGASSLPAGVASAKTAAGKRKVPVGKTVRSAPIVLFQINRHERLTLRPTDERGRPVPGFQRKFDNFMRCHHTNKRHAMNPRLARLLYETGRRYPGRRVEVISGYRHPKVAKNPRSPHKKGLACDLRVEGIKNTELRDFFRSTFKKVGVGYYPNSSFVHLDVRQGSSAFWIDYSGPGETALYSDDPNNDLQSGRADRWKRTIIDPSWAEQDDEAPAGGQPGDDGQHDDGEDGDGRDDDVQPESTELTAPRAPTASMLR